MTKTSQNGHIAPAPPVVLQRNEDAIRILKDLLEEAESGKLKGIAIVGSYYDRAVGTGWSANLNIYETIGGLEHLKWRLNHYLDSQK